MGREVPLLLLADQLTAVDDVLNVVRRDFEQCHLAATSKEAAEWFDAHEARVVLTAFDDVRAAEEAYLAMFSASNRAHTLPHHTILLCEGSDAKNAFEACTRGVFNDYMIYRPLYDPWRLRLSIHNAVERLSSEGDPGISRQGLVRMQEGVDSLRQLLDKLMMQGSELKTSARSVYVDLATNLENHLHALRRQLASSVFEEAVQVVNEELLKDRFAQFQKGHIQKEVDRVRMQLERWSDSWTDGAKNARDECEKRASHAGLSLTERPRSVLVVDDDEMCHRFFEAALTAEGFEVHRALDGFRGLRLMAQLRPDVVIMDVHMPKLDGLEAVTKAKSSLALKDIPILMLTGDADSEIVRNAIRAGAADFIVKPANRATLARKIRKALQLQA